MPTPDPYAHYAKQLKQIMAPLNAKLRLLNVRHSIPLNKQGVPSLGTVTKKAFKHAKYSPGHPLHCMGFTQDRDKP